MFNRVKIALKGQARSAFNRDGLIGVLFKKEGRVKGNSDMGGG